MFPSGVSRPFFTLENHNISRVCFGVRKIKAPGAFRKYGKGVSTSSDFQMKDFHGSGEAFLGGGGGS